MAYESPWNIGWTLAFSFVAVLVCVSNLLILVAFSTKALRKRSYYQVINLSVADLAVGIVVMPLYVGTQITYWTKKTLANAVYFTDPFFGIASFLVLSIISCERLYVVVWPFKYRFLQKRHYAIALALPWLIAAVVAVVDGWPMVYIPNPLLALIVISLGLIVIFSSYVALWIKKISGFRPENRPNRVALRHKRLAKTLFITTVASLITWLPFHLYVSYHIVCECPYPSAHILCALKLLHFGNSFINGIIYSLRIREFRGTVRRTFHQQLSRTRTRTMSRMTETSRADAPTKNREVRETVL